MKRIMIFLGLLIILANSLCSQELIFKVQEVKGNIDVKNRDGSWKTVEVGDVLVTGNEIFTGLHSHISLEIDQGTFVTVNQLSHLIIERVRLKKDEFNSELLLKTGYVIVYSKNYDNLQNRILITFFGGNILFNNSGGEIYFRQENGAVIKSFQGLVKIRTKIINKYFIRKNEVCAITQEGHLLENDYFIRRNINTNPLEYQNEADLLYYYQQLVNYYSNDVNQNDYGEGLGINSSN
ncbi:MAG: hypothetical protein MJB14_07385 [Spirochaetes bacterium]|nr:hypothetical protein [Spirochaetota bacterium]